MEKLAYLFLKNGKNTHEKCYSRDASSVSSRSNYKRFTPKKQSAQTNFFQVKHKEQNQKDYEESKKSTIQHRVRFTTEYRDYETLFNTFRAGYEGKTKHPKRAIDYSQNTLQVNKVLLNETEQKKFQNFLQNQKKKEKKETQTRRGIIKNKTFFKETEQNKENFKEFPLCHSGKQNHPIKFSLIQKKSFEYLKFCDEKNMVSRKSNKKINMTSNMTFKKTHSENFQHNEVLSSYSIKNKIEERENVPNLNFVDEISQTDYYQEQPSRVSKYKNDQPLSSVYERIKAKNRKLSHRQHYLKLRNALSSLKKQLNCQTL